jgi:hypothetical protein
MEGADMPSDPESDRYSGSSVEKLLNALDEVRDAVNRVAVESTTSRQAAPSLVRTEPASPVEFNMDRSPGPRE